ncbi:MAG: hypothetical protein IJP92_00885 [Lachnospiraceae bacterium]|nr:hypothetical protein [Lachnospiraceae bacterium]
MVYRALFLYAYFMAYIYFNENPLGKSTGDCTVRAISILIGKDWDDIYWDLCEVGYYMAEMPSTNSVWGEYLKENGYVRENLPDTCPICYTIEQFCKDHPMGKYAVATGTHVVAVVDGNAIDAWNSLMETATYFWRRR